jgi:hypothetical protein
MPMSLENSCPLTVLQFQPWSFGLQVFDVKSKLDETKNKKGKPEPNNIQSTRGIPKVMKQKPKQNDITQNRNHRLEVKQLETI